MKKKEFGPKVPKVGQTVRIVWMGAKNKKRYVLEAKVRFRIKGESAESIVLDMPETIKSPDKLTYCGKHGWKARDFQKIVSLEIV